MFLKLVILIVVSLNCISSEEVVEETDEEMTTEADAMEEHTEILLEEEEETQETAKQDSEPATEKIDVQRKLKKEITNIKTRNSTQDNKENMEPCMKSEASSLRN